MGIIVKREFLNDERVGSMLSGRRHKINFEKTSVIILIVIRLYSPQELIIF